MASGSFSSDVSPSVGSSQEGSDAVPVIYIAGWGHSGSTLMDMVIGSASNVVSVGEIIFYDYYRTHKSHVKMSLRDFECTCGKSFKDCVFWHAVDEQTTTDGQTAPQVLYDKTNTERIRWFFRFVCWRFFSSKKHSSQQADPPQLGDDTRLFKTILNRAGPQVRYICDSSKDFSRIARLLMNPGLEIHPIFLVRDGRGVSYSYAKKKRAEAGLRSVGLLKAALLWVIVNLLTKMVIRLSGKKFIRLSYNRFCEDPAATISMLNEKLGIDIDPEDFIKQINQEIYHNLGGNLMRFKQLESIRQDEGWQKGVTGIRRIVLNVITWPWNLIWVRGRNS